jgi:hypothetical protein
MLASITPLGERGRRSRWGVTVTAFLLGATLAGAALGALIGAAGGLIPNELRSPRARLVVLAAAIAVAIVLDLVPGAAPGPRRQVNERWLDELRGWVYGLGFGAQLGLGITTVVSSAATYVALLAALLIGDPARGALVVGLFGLVRGLPPLITGRVRQPRQLFAIHARLERLRGPVAAAVVALLLGLLACAAAGVVA